MSSEQPYKSPDGLEPKKSNSVLIVIVVAVALVIPTLCVCGGAAAWLFLTVPVESGQIEPFIEFDSIDSVRPIEAVPRVEPVPPIEAVPPIQPAPPIEPPPGDEGTAK